MWWQPLVLTLQLMAVSVAVAGVIGIIGAWAANVTEGGGKSGRLLSRVFLAAMVAAIAMPMILHAAAWEATAGKFGWVPLTQTGTDRFLAFGGLLACGWIHGVVGAALVALATWFGTRRLPEAMIGQSLLDAGPIAAWWLVRLPLAMPWVAASLLATAALAATEMTVVDLYGYRSLADEFYLFYAVDPTISSVVMTCVMPLVVACTLIFCLFGLRFRMPTTQREVQDGPVSTDFPPLRWRWVAVILTLLVILLVIIVPIAGLVIKAGHQVIVDGDQMHVSWSMKRCVITLLAAPQTFAAEYRWTAVLAVMTAIVAIVVAWPLAAIGRTHRAGERVFDVGSIFLVLIPGPIVGLTVVRIFQLDLPGMRMLYQQTLLPTVLALSVRAVPVAYWIFRSGYRGIDRPVWDASRLDVSWAGRIWSVDRLLLKGSLFAAWLAAAVVASGDVPATLPVVPAGVTTVGTRLFGLLHSGARYHEASLALWYVGAIVLVAMIWLTCGGARRAKV